MGSEESPCILKKCTKIVEILRSPAGAGSLRMTFLGYAE